MSNQTAVIGLGNTLRRDDGIGIAVLESLLKFYPRKDIDYLDFGVASFDLIHRLQEYKRVILIDGIDANLATAALKIFTLSQASYTLASSTISTHELDLKGLFELCKKFEVKTKIFIAGIQVADTAFGEGLTPQLKSKLSGITKEISIFIDKKLCVTPSREK